MIDSQHYTNVTMQMTCHLILQPLYPEVHSNMSCEIDSVNFG
jgi:hypothetical protein